MFNKRHSIRDIWEFLQNFTIRQLETHLKIGSRRSRLLFRASLIKNTACMSLSNVFCTCSFSVVRQVLQPKVQRQVAHRAAQNVAEGVQKARVAAGHGRGRRGLREEVPRLWVLRAEVRVEGPPQRSPD